MTERPKRPLSAYMLWLNETRESIKKENPGMKVTEIAKRGGELWRAMGDKSEWEAKAAKLKEQYNVNIKEFEDNGGVKEGNKKRKKAGTKAPKKSKKKQESEEESFDEESE